MAKAKSKEPSKPGTPYRDEELAEFVAALESDDQQETSETEEKKESIAARRKIIVQEEETSHHRSDDQVAEPIASSSIDHVLGHEPPETMQRLTKSKRGNFRWVWIVALVALLAGASLAGWLFFNRTKKFTGTNVQLQFKPITSATSGGTLTLTIDYQNLEPVDLTQAQITVEYPEGFTYTQSTPTATNEFHNAFSIGTIKSGRSGTITITGTLIGAVGDASDFSALLTYRPSTFNSDFQQRATTTVKITASILSLQLTGPTQLAPGATGTWVATYTNTSDHDLQNVQLEATYASGFTVTSTTPTKQNQSAVWNIAKVTKGGHGTITIVGTVNGNLGDTVPIKMSVGMLTSTNVVNKQDEQSLLVILVKTGVTTTIAVNGSTDPVVISPGETLNYSVRVTNTSDVALSNVTVRATLSGAPVDPTKLTVDGSAVVANTTITWTKDNLAALATVQPNQSVTLSFTDVTLATVTVKTDQDRNQQVSLAVDVVAPNLTTNANGATQPSTVAVTKVATVLGLTAEARYYDAQGTTLGSGPLPPVVGATTVYRILWTATNTTSDATTMVVTARLPNSVLWTGQHLVRDAGDLTFDPNTRIVSWTLNTIPAGTGSRLPSLTAHFDVSITPTTEQIGTVPVLLETSSIAATDSFTNKALTATATTLTAALPTDSKANGQGTVVAQ